MKMYLLKQDVVQGDETFDSVVVVAESEDTARKIHPVSQKEWENDSCWEWVTRKDIDKIKVIYLGETHLTERVILASFNAG